VRTPYSPPFSVFERFSLETRSIWLTSVVEVRAANAAGMRALVVDRPGNVPLSEADRRELIVVENLSEVKLG
jgi:methionine salvage enolase-phosphatase E1